MGGLFSGNFEKEGPGVEKDAPKKNRFFLFFELFFRKIWKLIEINFIYAMFCLLIVTIGPATAGFTYILRNFVREEHAFIWMDFIDAFKDNWKQSLAVFGIDIVVGALGFGVYRFYSQIITQQGGVLFYIAFGIVGLLLLLYLFARYYIYTIMVTMDMSLKNIYRNAFLLALLGFGPNLLLTLICAAIMAGLVFLAFSNPYAGIVVIVAIPVILLSLFSFLAEFITYPVFEKYLLIPSQRVAEGLTPFEEPKDDDEEDFDDLDDDDDEDTEPGK